MNGELTRADLMETIRATAQEILDYNLSATEIDDLYDAIHENADGLVNPYYGACAQEWLVANMPDPDDYGMSTEPDDDINRRISIAMYGWYAHELSLVLEDLLTERNEAIANHEVSA
jgi:hypothetical protein